MKIKYDFANETAEIDVSEEWASILIDLDRQEYNNDHKETRRHYSLDAIVYEGTEYGAPDSGIAELLRDPTLEEMLPAAIAQLQPQQQRLIQRIFYEGVRPGQIAAEEGVSNAAISRRLNKIYAALKKYFSARG